MLGSIWVIKKNASFSFISWSEENQFCKYKKIDIIPLIFYTFFLLYYRMRIGIDCRTYGSLHGYIGKYMEYFVSYLMENEDENEYVLFFHDREVGEFTIPKSSRFHIVKTSTQIGSVREQICFSYELSKEKLDVVFFSHPNIPLFYRGKTIVLLPDLVPYFYPGKDSR